MHEFSFLHACYILQFFVLLSGPLLRQRLAQMGKALIEVWHALKAPVTVRPRIYGIERLGRLAEYHAPADELLWHHHYPLVWARIIRCEDLVFGFDSPTGDSDLADEKIFGHTY